MAYPELPEAKAAAIRWAKEQDTVVRVRKTNASDRANCDLGDAARWVAYTTDYDGVVPGGEPLIVVGPRANGEFWALTDTGHRWQTEAV